jgi:hypothetical protein
MRKLGLILALIVTGGLAKPTSAAISYQYAVDNANPIGVSPANSFYNGTPGPSGTATAISVPVGTLSVTLNLYLVEIGATPATSIINNNNGMFAATFEIARTGGTGTLATLVPSSIIGNASLYNPTGSQSSTTNNYILGNNSATLADYQEIQGSPQAVGAKTQNINTFDRVFLGTVQISTASATGTTNFYIGYFPDTPGQVNQGSPPFGGSTTVEGVPVGGGGTQFDLDQSNTPGVPPQGSYTGAVFTNFSITIEPSAVPEPGSLFLVGGVFAAGFGRWWVRRRNAKEVPVLAV